MWLVASAQLDDLAAVRDGNPALWRDVRRFNPPIQLAVAAAHAVLAHAACPHDAAIVSLAPCQSGSPELHRWVRDIEAGGAVKMNPTHTLHAVDNLALSVLSIALGNHAWAMSLGGAAGMAWTALELALERAELGDREVVVVGGDQVSGVEPSPASACALLFAHERTPYAGAGRALRLVGIERRRRALDAAGDAPSAEMARGVASAEARTDMPRADVPMADASAEARTSGRLDFADIGTPAPGAARDDTAAADAPLDFADLHPLARVVPHAAAGAIGMLAVLRAAPSGRFAYAVPAADGDGLDDVVVHWEIGA